MASVGLGMAGDEGGRLKASGGWHEYSPNMFLPSINLSLWMAGWNRPPFIREFPTPPSSQREISYLTSVT